MKTRLDILLTEGGYAPSREKAKALIMEGLVYVNGQKEDKAGASFDPEKSTIEVRGQALAYVSRGGLKLDKAMMVFPLDLTGRVCMDIGASTGGFTDCMLQNGAAKVYAIDVGYGQLAWKLRNDPRVVCMEKTNFRYLTPADLPEAPSFASVDVSFISLSKILPAAAPILTPRAQMVCLIKPQFEAGREKVGKKGVVRDPAVHEEVIAAAIGYARENGFEVMGLDFSPIRGPEGNIEYLMYLVKKEEDAPASGENTGCGQSGEQGDGAVCGQPGEQGDGAVIAHHGDPVAAQSQAQEIRGLVERAHETFVAQ
ncbi:MAG: TlyA family RNA methyltransferase [Eubacteriales bacterium]|nr:TlyA family RNA methyltransferase [Eubacteriales bacterium]